MVSCWKIFNIMWENNAINHPWLGMVYTCWYHILMVIWGMVCYCFTHITQALETENIGGAIWAYWSPRLSGPGRHQDLKCFDGYLSNPLVVQVHWSDFRTEPKPNFGGTQRLETIPTGTVNATCVYVGYRPHRPSCSKCWCRLAASRMGELNAEPWSENIIYGPRGVYNKLPPALCHRPQGYFLESSTSTLPRFTHENLTYPQCPAEICGTAL